MFVVSDTDVERDYLVIYLTGLFGLIAVASAGLPLALGNIDSSSPVKIGIGWCITIIGLLPSPIILYKLLTILLKPFINNKTASYWYLYTSALLILIPALAWIVHYIEIIGYNMPYISGIVNYFDAIEYTVPYMYVIYIVFFIVSLFSIDAILREKNLPTLRSFITKVWNERSPSAKLLLKDFVFVFLLPIILFYSSSILLLGIPYVLLGLLLGPSYITILLSFFISICLSLLLSLDASITRWRKNRKDKVTLGLVDSLRENLIPIYLRPIGAYFILVVLTFILCIFILAIVSDVTGWRLQTEINTVGIVITLLTILISTTIPYYMVVRMAIVRWEILKK